MKKCNSCGTDNLENALFCEWCGKRLSPESEDVPIAVLPSKNDEINNTDNSDVIIASKKDKVVTPLELQVGGLYDGKVTRILPIGAFVELAPGKEGLVFISKLADHRVDKVEDVVNVGDMIWVKITDIDEKGRISLSHKDAVREINIKQQNGITVSRTYICSEISKQKDETDFHVGSLLKGTVTRVLSIGAFVELAPGKEGLVFISKLADHRVDKVEDVVNVGDMIWVKITDIDEKGRISLSRKDAMCEIELKRQHGEIIE